ncbi:alpha-ketoglutarate-dependent dioxygenase AlkB [Flavobacterium sp. LHD-80]|uniref:alpha-ketoglutarate-dependent dioxygenase AlkB n=1 Tax=Flavobacterium sp. LHD-80 TaxID=3071411 RepID=UPI0027E1828B|nr:alpha-ketoglutarate-dependent dioxygenase AlkB [Flavobacterium sp. LHD-80]MDQ6470133.1 alpha-ketoglutarate-dependent dioxygenase AlkB [Flavobacterium sp. LHD-80]
MKIKELRDEIIVKNNILQDSTTMLYHLKNNIDWDNSMISRKTASFGIPYNYSNVYYARNEIPDFLEVLINVVKSSNGFMPNNCLINFYYDSNSKMGFHSDQIDILYKNTGIAIFSFGSSRTMRFKNKSDFNIIYDILLENNSYLYMSQEIQKEWLHSILPVDIGEKNERFSITFRKIIINKNV